jgi:hypothetical protein
MVTAGWLSSAVEKTWLFLVGMVVLRSDQLGEHAAQRLDAQRQRGHVEQQHVLDVALQHAALDGGADGHASSGLTSLRGSLPKNSLTFSCTLGMRVMPPTRITSSMSLALTAGVLDACGTGSMVRSIRSSTSELELGAGELDVQVLRAGRVGRDVGQVDVRSAGAGQLDLGLLGGFLQALQGQHVLGQVDALLLLELVDDVVDDALVEVFAAQEGVAVGGQHLELLLAVDVGDLDDGHVEGAAAQVIDGDLAVALAFLSRPKASAAAVGSLMMRLTSRPAMRPASLVAWRWLSLK